MKNSLAAALSFAVLVSLAPRLQANQNRALQGSLLVSIFEENGNKAASSHVYIYGKDKKNLIDGQDVANNASFTLPPGRYQVYAATTRQSAGYIDHFTSHEATVTVGDEPASVILTLKRAPDADITITDATLKKLRIDPELAKYLN